MSTNELVDFLYPSRSMFYDGGGWSTNRIPLPKPKCRGMSGYTPDQITSILGGLEPEFWAWYDDRRVGLYGANSIRHYDIICDGVKYSEYCGNTAHGEVLSASWIDAWVTDVWNKPPKKGQDFSIPTGASVKDFLASMKQADEAFKEQGGWAGQMQAQEAAAKLGAATHAVTQAMWATATPPYVGAMGNSWWKAANEFGKASIERAT